MKRNFLIFGLVLFLSILAGFFYVQKKILQTSEINLKDEKAIVSIKSSDLVTSYTKNETSSDALYGGKIIEVTGEIQEISFVNNRITIVLKSSVKTFGVICDINLNQKEKIKQLTINQNVRIKGICKGFLKDVILLNCFIDVSTNE